MQDEVIIMEPASAGLAPADVSSLTDEIVDGMLGLFGDYCDVHVTLSPQDLQAYEEYAAD